MQPRILIQSRASRVWVALAGAALACNLTPSAPPTSAPEPSSSPEPALLSSPTAAIEPTPIDRRPLSLSLHRLRRPGG